MAGVDCTYLPLFEMTYKECERLPSGRPYSGMNFFVPPRPSLKLLKTEAWCCLLCWDMHILQRDLAEIQKERKPLVRRRVLDQIRSQARRDGGSGPPGTQSGR